MEFISEHPLIYTLLVLLGAWLPCIVLAKALQWYSFRLYTTAKIRMDDLQGRINKLAEMDELLSLMAKKAAAKRETK